MNEKVKSFIYSFPLSQSFGNLTLDFLVLMEVQNIKLNVFLTCIGELSAAIAVKPTISLKLLSNSQHFYKAGARASFFFKSNSMNEAQEINTNLSLQASGLDYNKMSINALMLWSCGGCSLEVPEVNGRWTERIRNNCLAWDELGANWSKTKVSLFNKSVEVCVTHLGSSSYNRSSVFFFSQK